MCGKCGKMAARGGCVVKLLGVVFMALAAASRLWGFAIAGLGARSFAGGAMLLLLLSIAISNCPMCGGACSCGCGCDACSCGSEGHEHPAESKGDSPKKKQGS